MALNFRISGRWLSRLGVVLIVLGLIGLIVIGRAWYRAYDYNQALAAGAWQRAAAHPSAHGELAAAYALAERRTTDDFAATVSAFARVTSSAAPAEIRRPARYDLATLYLERGLQLLADEQPDLAYPLLELAKGLYRERLRAEPDHWDSKYNLERALRAAPDLAEEQTPPELRRPATSSRAIGTGRARRELP